MFTSCCCSTAIAYINHKEGTHSKVMSDLALESWEWCLAHKITIHAEHIPGVNHNTVELRQRFKPINFKKYGILTMGISLQHDTTGSSFVISASDQTQAEHI